MQRRASAFKGYTIEASDGKVGSVTDLLFDDRSWTLRWLVINTGSWLSGRKVLIHPRTLEPADIAERAFPVKLTQREVQDSPDLASDAPVTMQMDKALNTYYGYPGSWSGGGYGDGYAGSSGNVSWTNSPSSDAAEPDGDPHLRSLNEVTGYRIHALDGDIGHLDDLLLDNETWAVEYVVIDTKNWGFGKHVLVSPAEISEIDWGARDIHVDLTCYKIKSSPSWQEPNWSDRPAV
jgi:sporulation protein YlmC with PRC-barrel domain